MAIFIIEKRTNETFLVVFSQLFFLFISGQRMKMKSAQQSLARRYFVHVYSITTGLLLLCSADDVGCIQSHVPAHAVYTSITWSEIM